jgi:hypothetical protein
VRQGVAALLKVQHGSCANLQLLLPQQADTTAHTDEEGLAPLLPASLLVKELQQRNRMNIVVLSQGDTVSGNVGLEAALKADPHLSRCAMYACSER